MGSRLRGNDKPGGHSARGISQPENSAPQEKYRRSCQGRLKRLQKLFNLLKYGKLCQFGRVFRLAGPVGQHIILDGC